MDKESNNKLDLIPRDNLCISNCGLPLAFDKFKIYREPFNTLIPDDKIIQIGNYSKNGKITSSSRVDSFKPYIIYSGWSYAPDFNGEGIFKVLLFRDPLVKFIDVYALYAFADLKNEFGELYSYDFKRNSLRIFQLNFTKLINPIS